MTRPSDLDLIVSKLKSADFSEDINADEMTNLLADLETLLNSDCGINLLKQPTRYYENVLTLFVKLIFSEDIEIAKSCLKYSEVMIDIFRFKLPKIKKGEWWKKFELEFLLKLVSKLSDKISPLDNSWTQIWNFVANLVINDSALSTVSLNTLLSISEVAFKRGKKEPEILDQAWLCWRSLIDVFDRSPKILLPSKTLNLLLKPLLACHSVSKLRIDTWIYLIEVKGITSTDDSLNLLVEPFCKAMYKLPSEKAISRHLPEECAQALLKLLSYDIILERCLFEIVDTFSACVNSKPSTSTLEKLASHITKAINDVKDDNKSIKLWELLMDQYKGCHQNPILKQVCHVFFSEVNFQRWVDSGIVESKEIAELMENAEFRSKVLLHSIEGLSFPCDDEKDSTLRKNKNKKSSCEVIWSNYCEAFLHWWNQHNSPTVAKENDKIQQEHNMISSDHDGFVFQATQALILYPIQLNNWNATIFKQWSSLCEACNNRGLLQSLTKQIFDSLAGQNFQIQKVIDILTFLSGLDIHLCKQADAVLGQISTEIDCFELRHVMDLLYVLEAFLSYNEYSSIVSNILKRFIDKCSDFDHLNAHKIRTKVGKITRKLEQIANSVDRDKSSKHPRTPFRTQSNFLQRLAKAEEKNKTKNPFLSSMLSGSEKSKLITTEGIENNISVEIASLDSSQESLHRFSDDVSSKNCLKTQEDCVNTPAGVSPSTIKENFTSAKSDCRVRENGIVDEKENVIHSNQPASPLTSPTNKIKVINARELKTGDPLSPAVIKKVKPIAGQKVTPKKLTPSKVSYFDDDASDCVMVPPKPKTTPLTDHQMEVMSKRRADIPALYQDLSQDTQLSNNPPVTVVVQEVVSNTTPHNVIHDSEDIVLGTPSPAEQTSTPQHSRNISKLGSSAKKLNFNNLMSISSSYEKSEHHNVTETNDSSRDNSPFCDEQNVYTSTPAKDVNISEITAEDGNMGTATINVGTNACSEVKQKNDTTSETSPSLNPKNICLTPNKKQGSTVMVEGEKTRRKRKSEPIKVSPKLTRSKKSLKSMNGAVLSKSLTSDISNKKFTAEVPIENFQCADITSEEKNVSQVENLIEKTNALEDTSMLLSVSTASETIENCKLTASVDCSNQSVVEHVSLDDSELEGDFNVTVKKRGKKRKNTDLTSDNSKKSKTLEESEDIPLVEKGNLLKKKKKMFKLSTNNLENWVVKTDRVTSSVNVSSCTTSSVNNLDENNEDHALTSCPHGGDGKQENKSLNILNGLNTSTLCSDNDEISTIELDNSEEIILSTQEMTSPSVPSSIHLPTLEAAENDDVFCKEGNKSNSLTEDSGVTSNIESREKNVGEALSEEPISDEIDLIISSPTKRQRRASSVMRDEDDIYSTRDKTSSEVQPEALEEDSCKRLLRQRIKSSPLKQTRKSLHPPGGRSARMLRMAVSSTSQDEENAGLVTPTRRRENIVPLTYGENWPKGPTEDWVACTPVSPFASSFRSALKKTPLTEEKKTPVHTAHDPLTSPLLSSAKRKRVVFLDPPVTTGLIYDGSFGSIHLADVPQGSPYPTWKGEEELLGGIEKYSPKHEKKSNLVTDATMPEQISPLSNHETAKNYAQSQFSDVNEKIERVTNVDALVSNPGIVELTSEPNSRSNSETLLNDMKIKFQLDNDFMDWFSQLNPFIQDLLKSCFESEDMPKTVDDWKVRDYKSVCELPLSFLHLVRNLKGEILAYVLDKIKVPAPIEDVISETVTVQTESPLLVTTYAQTIIPSLDAEVQTEIRSTSTAATNTVSPPLTTSSTQADLTLPSKTELVPILKSLGIKNALEYFSDSLRLLSSLQHDDN